MSLYSQELNTDQLIKPIYVHHHHPLPTTAFLHSSNLVNRYSLTWDQWQSASIQQDLCIRTNYSTTRLWLCHQLWSMLNLFRIGQCTANLHKWWNKSATDDEPHCGIMPIFQTCCERLSTTTFCWHSHVATSCKINHLLCLAVYSTYGHKTNTGN